MVLDIRIRKHLPARVKFSPRRKAIFSCHPITLPLLSYCWVASPTMAIMVVA